MVHIRHRGANYKSSNDFWSAIPTQNNRRIKVSSSSHHHSKKKNTLWRLLLDFQIPVWFMIMVVLMFFLANHHQEKQRMQLHHDTWLQEEQQRNDYSKILRHRSPSKNRRHRNNGDDEDDDQELQEKDLSKLATPQEDQYWIKQEEKLRKEREEFEAEKELEEREIRREREEIKHKREVLKKDEVNKKPTKEKVISPKEYLAQMIKRHSNEPNHWSLTCWERMKSQFSSGKASDEELLSFVFECASEYASGALVGLNKDISFQQKERQHVAGLLENYTCTDPAAPGSLDLYPPYEWKSPHPYRYHDPPTIRVRVKLDRHASRVHVLENFIDDEECQAMEDAARSKLHVATTANGKGGSQVSDARKAMQAGIRVPWNKEKDGHPIARISRRVYDYTNHVLGLEIDEHGQEDLMSIQYTGRGRIHNPDRYTPHCDGDCSGSPFRPGTRMATMVMYCTIPEVGGATNFHNSNVHVKPKHGSAVFFSYMDPISNMTDNRYTEHSGCPVYEGEKKIVTQWIRLGVSEKDPWTSFNTLGIKYADASKYE